MKVVMTRLNPQRWGKGQMQIEELISDYCPTMIFVEHDQAFCENIATETLNSGA